MKSKKKFYFIIIIFVLLINLSLPNNNNYENISLATTIYYSENFNNLSAVPSLWTVVTGDNDSYNYFIGKNNGPSWDDDDCLVLSNTGVTPLRLTYDIAESLATVTTLECDFQYNGTGSQVFQVENNTGYLGGIIQSIAFRANSNILIKNGTTSYDTGILTTPLKWYNLKIVVDPTGNGTSKVYIDNVQIGDTFASYTNKPGNIRKITVQANNLTTKMRVDNVNVYSGLPAISQGEFIAKSDFNDETIGNAPYGWNLSGTADDKAINVTTGGQNNDNCLKLIATSPLNANVLAQNTFPPQIGLTTVEADIYLSNKEYNAIDLYASTGERLTRIRFDSNGITTKTMNPITVIDSTNVNKWYNIKVVFDFSTYKYDMYVNGVLRNKALDFDNLVPNIGIISLTSLNTTLDGTKFDNIKIFSSGINNIVFKDAQQNDIKNLRTGSISAEVSISNKNSNPVAAVLIMALYEIKQGVSILKDIIYSSRNLIPSNENKSIVIDRLIDVQSSVNHVLKSFVWNDDSISPLTNFKELSNDDNQAISFFVATNGNDDNDGTIEAPFATLERARNAIRNLKSERGLPDGGVTVNIRDGDYYLNSSFNLEWLDSGSQYSSIVYKAYGTENVRLLNGVSLNPTDFNQVTDENVISRLTNGMESKVLQYDLKSNNYTDVGPLIFNGELMSISRYPNNDYIQVGTVIDPGDRDLNRGFTIGYSGVSWADNNWSNADTTSTSYTLAVANDSGPAGTGDKALVMATNSTTDNSLLYVRKRIPKQTFATPGQEITTVEFDGKFNGYFNLWLAEDAAATKSAAMFRVRGNLDNNMSVWNGTNQMILYNRNTVPRTFNNIKLVINGTTSKYDLYINNNHIGQYNFYQSATALEYIRFQNINTGAEGNIIDNVKVYSGNGNPENFILNEGFQNLDWNVTNDSRIDRWVNATHLKLFGYWFYEWAEQTVGVKSIDTQAKTITSLSPSSYSVRPEGRYYAFNLIEELDTEGEYYFDRDTGILYFYPPATMENANILLSVNKNPLITLDKASYISFQNLNFEGGRGNAIKIGQGSDNNLFYNCSFKNFGDISLKDYAIVIEGENNGIVRSNISNVNGAIQIISGDRQTLEPANNYVENCEIFNFNIFGRATAGYAVDMRGVGNRLSNNRIHKSDKQAIIFLGNDNIIENNEIFDVLLHADDLAAIYSWRDLTKRGNIIRNNFIHSLGNKSELGVKATNTNVGLFAMYFDDGSSGTIVENNIIYNVPIGIFINGGRDNMLNNNIFYNVDKTIAISDIVAQPRSDAQWESTKYDIFKAGTNELTVPYNIAPYTKYPNLANILEDEPRKPKYNIVKNNITNTNVLVDVNWARQVISEAEMWEINDFQTTHYIVGEADFVDISSKNFNIKDITKIHAISPEFKPIDIEGIGIIPEN